MTSVPTPAQQLLSLGKDRPRVSAERPSLDAYRQWTEVPLADPPLISIVIPSYNEEWRILPTIGAIASEMCRRGEPWELIVSDDGSKDDTRQIVRDLDFANLVLLEHGNTGKGGAVKRGLLAARGQYVLFADADQSTPIEQFDALLTEVKAGASVAIGSRAAEGAEVQNKSVLRNLLSFGLHQIVRIGYRLPVSDTQCGFKLFTREAVDALVPLQRIEGFSFDLELLYLAKRGGYGIAEVPVEWIDAPGSTVDPAKVALQFLKDLVRIRWWALTGKYPVQRRILANDN